MTIGSIVSLSCSSSAFSGIPHNSAKFRFQLTVSRSRSVTMIASAVASRIVLWIATERASSSRDRFWSVMSLAVA